MTVLISSKDINETRTIRKHYVTICGVFEEESDYKELHQLLRNATPDDHITLVVSNDGGATNVASQVVASLVRTQAVIRLELGMINASAASVLLLHAFKKAESIIIPEHGTVMFHQTMINHVSHANNPALEGIGDMLKIYDRFGHKQTKAFLTKKEWKKYKSGQDVRIDNLSIYKRLKSQYPNKEITLLEI